MWVILPPILSLYGRYLDVSVCDAGYGSEENYLYAFQHGIETFIKYNYFHKEQKRSFKNDPFLSASFYYNEETDGMYCPMGQRMERLSDAKRVTDNGFVQTISRYRARNCNGWPIKMPVSQKPVRKDSTGESPPEKNQGKGT